MHAIHLFAATLHVEGSHLFRDSLTLGVGDWCQPLGFEKVDTSAFVAEVRLEADKDDGRRWAKVEDFGIPLDRD